MFKDHFSATSADYARARPVWSTAVVEHLARIAPATTLAWDVGCGSGQLSVPLADRFARVVATDASAAQLAQARPHARVEYRLADEASSGLADGTVDLVTAAQAAHWFELPRFYAEVRRVLRPGGVVALLTYDRFTFEPAIDELVEDLYTRVLGRHWPAERRHVEARYRTLDFPFAELPAPALALEAHLRRDDLLANVATWSAVSELRKVDPARAEDELERFAIALATRWPDGERIARWPVTIRAGT